MHPAIYLTEHQLGSDTNTDEDDQADGENTKIADYKLRTLKNAGNAGE